MITKCWPTLIFLMISCSSPTQFSAEEQTSVVITKNPKGQAGGSGETRQVEFNAPWLADSNELQLELRSVTLSDADANRSIVGTLDAGVCLRMTKNSKGAVEFSATAEEFKNAKHIEFEIQSAVVKSQGKNIPVLSKPIVLKLNYDDNAQRTSNAKKISAYLNVAFSTANSSCEFSSTVSATATQTETYKECGGQATNTSGSGRDDDDDDRDDRDND
jgi:hypothetical protein